MDNDFSKLGLVWTEDFQYAWQTILPKIQIKFDLEKKHLFPLIMFVNAAVYYFRFREYVNKNIEKDMPVYPSGLDLDINFQLDEHFRITRSVAVEFFLIPKSALKLAEFDEDGFDVDLIKLFEWEDRKYG